DRPSDPGAVLRARYLHGRGSRGTTGGTRPGEAHDADEKQALPPVAPHERRRAAAEEAGAFGLHDEPPAGPATHEGRAEDFPATAQEIRAFEQCEERRAAGPRRRRRGCRPGHCDGIAPQPTEKTGLSPAA